MTNTEFNNSTLVPIDFSENSLLALDHAVGICDALNENNQLITLLHVIENGSFDKITGHGQLPSTDKDSLAVEGAIHRLEKIITKYQDKSNTTYKYIIASGKPYRTIAEIAEDIFAGTIVMGTHGSSGMQMFAGSNASRVIQISPCPVVVIKEKPFGKGYKNIVLPLDLTRESKQKVNIAAKIAKKFNATIHIVAGQESDEFLSHRLQLSLAQVADYLNERGVENTCQELPVGSNFGMKTIAFAQGMNADLIIIMSQQEKGLREYFYGSHSQQIVSRSPIPVMAVNTNPELDPVFENIVGRGVISE